MSSGYTPEPALLDVMAKYGAAPDGVGKVWGLDDHAIDQATRGYISAVPTMVADIPSVFPNLNTMPEAPAAPPVSSSPAPESYVSSLDPSGELWSVNGHAGVGVAGAPLGDYSAKLAELNLNNLQAQVAQAQEVQKKSTPIMPFLMIGAVLFITYKFLGKRR